MDEDENLRKWQITVAVARDDYRPEDALDGVAKVLRDAGYEIVSLDVFPAQDVATRVIPGT